MGPQPSVGSALCSSCDWTGQVPISQAHELAFSGPAGGWRWARVGLHHIPANRQSGSGLCRSCVGAAKTSLLFASKLGQQLSWQRLCQSHTQMQCHKRGGNGDRGGLEQQCLTLWQERRSGASIVSAAIWCLLEGGRVTAGATQQGQMQRPLPCYVGAPSGCCVQSSREYCRVLQVAPPQMQRLGHLEQGMTPPGCLLQSPRSNIPLRCRPPDQQWLDPACLQREILYASSQQQLVQGAREGQRGNGLIMQLRVLQGINGCEHRLLQLLPA